MDHLDTIHQCRKSFHDQLRGALGQWLDELFQSLKILDVILCLIERLGNSQFDASPS